ncbi:DUF3291 domain-containing protein [Rhodobacterales bacterium HKCCE2091]|nr:DUF3291 domain-containing protein [Rhodobacterales bacterium HKCCE2091]
MTDLDGTIPPPGPDHELFEVNVARLVAPIDDPRIADFADNLDRINALAERMDGFVWRHVDDSGNATQTRVGADPLLIYNASVWRGGASLDRFVFGTLHARFYARRREWFGLFGGAHHAMWWVAPGERPDPEEAMERLTYMQHHGPTETAFGWPELPGATLWREGRCPPVAAE